MSFNDEMTGLMNAVRQQTGTSDKLSLHEAAALLKDFKGLRKNDIFQGIELTSNLTEPGWYHSAGRYLWGKPANVANQDDVEVAVIKDSKNNVAQLFFVNGIVWGRALVSNNWTSWNKLGGVIKTLLCAVQQHFSLSLIGGVA